jgi:outer membrane protein assembly factor BamD
MSVSTIWRTILAAVLTVLIAGCAGTIAPGSKTADVLFKEGEDYYASGKYEDAIAQWKRVRETYQSPELTALAEIKIADAQFENKSYIEAAAAYEDFRKLHPTNEKASYALYRQAMSYYNQMGKIDTDQTAVKNAVTLFQSFLQQYPKSEYAAEVGEKLENCRLRQLEYEIYVGRFYLRTEKYTAAIKRLEEALTTFPGSRGHDETLYYLGTAYLRNGQKDKARETFTRLFTEFGSSRFIGDARKAMEKYY